MSPIDSAIMEVVVQGVATYAELMMRCRKQDIVEKRWQAWKILTEKGFNQSEIARRFKMNSASVHHALKELKNDEDLKAFKKGIVKLK